MEQTLEQQTSSVCEEITIKNEPVQTEPCMYPKQEIEYVSVKEEMCLQEWEVPDGHNGRLDPLSIVKEEYSHTEDVIGVSTINVDKTQNKEAKQSAVSKHIGQVPRRGQRGGRPSSRGSSNMRPCGAVNLERSYEICQAAIQKSPYRDQLQSQLISPSVFLAANSYTTHIPAAKNHKTPGSVEADNQCGVVTSSRNENGQTRDTTNIKTFTPHPLVPGNVFLLPNNGTVNNTVGVSEPESVTPIAGLNTVTSSMKGASHRVQESPAGSFVLWIPATVAVLPQPQASPVMKELKHEVKFTSNSSEPASVIPTGGEEEYRTDANGNLISRAQLPDKTNSTIQCTTNQEGFCENISCKKHLVDSFYGCKKKYAKLQNLKKHRHVKSDAFLYTCNVCHKMFRGKRNLQSHLCPLTCEHPSSCDVCQKTFTTSNPMDSHFHQQKGEYPFN